MAKGNRRPPKKTITFDAACEVLERALRGPLRQDFVREAVAAKDFPSALGRLRSAMRSHAFRTRAGQLQLGDTLRLFDAKTREEGLQVTKEWDQAAHRYSKEDVPVLMLDYFAGASSAAHQRAQSLAVLLDFYFLYVLARVVMRIWDEGDANRNLDRISSLIHDLQGPRGSGQRFVEDAATLLFVATSNYQPDDQAYRRLLDRVWTLDEEHRKAVALIGGPVLGTHLRWALTAIYERDLVRMRDDNAVDYPWLLFSVATLMREYARLTEAGAEEAARGRVADALLNALSADPWAFVATPPSSLEELSGPYAEVRAHHDRHRERLVAELEALAPGEGLYSPISLQFNFPHNALVSLVVLALLATIPLPNLPLDALLTRPAGRWRDDAAELLARGVTGYAAAHPEQRGERRVLIVAYNQPLGLRSFGRTMAALRKDAGQGALAREGSGADQSSAMPPS